MPRWVLPVSGEDKSGVPAGGQLSMNLHFRSHDFVKGASVPGIPIHSTEVRTLLPPQGPRWDIIPSCGREAVVCCEWGRANGGLALPTGLAPGFTHLREYGNPNRGQIRIIYWRFVPLRVCAVDQNRSAYVEISYIKLDFFKSGPWIFSIDPCCTETILFFEISRLKFFFHVSW